MSAVYYYGQDGEIVHDEIKQLFELDEKELRWSSRLNASVFSIVDFVFNKDNILVVFPKHYFSTVELERYNCTHAELNYDIRLLFEVVQKYRQNTDSSAPARKYMGAQDRYESEYPFMPFFRVYDFYQKYGLYTEKNEKIVAGGNGKVLWKTTLDKAQKIISKNNLIFSPLYVKKKNLKSVFITDCMAFIIDYTVELFSCFLCMKKTGYHCRKFDFLNNIDYVISQLRQYENKTFKDMHKRLIASMIDFFEQYKYQTKAAGGNIHIRIRYFDMVWQDMVEKYLNTHFAGMHPTDNGVVFNPTQQISPVHFNKTTYRDVDDSPHDFSIELDHMAYDNDKLYIFDSKYYYEVSSLNYKQFSYNEILRYHYPQLMEINSVLILPGRENCKLHFSLGVDYIGSRRIGTRIIEQYLEPKHLMMSYLDNV